MSDTLDKQIAAQDIRLWYAYHDGKCPNCNLDLKSCHPLYNIYPHWSGDCKEQNENEKPKG